MDNTRAVIAEVDSVILDTGEVLGSDALGIIDDLQERQQAARLLVSEIAAPGTDPRAVERRLSEIGATSISASTDSTTRWMARLAKVAVRSPVRDTYLANLIALPQILPSN